MRRYDERGFEEKEIDSTMKNLAIVILSVLVIVLSGYCFVQQASIKEQEALTKATLEKAISYKEEAKTFQIQAERNAAEALMQAKLREECLSKKK